MDLTYLELPRTPTFLRWFFPLLTWTKPASSRAIYLTFDDGPTAGVTDAILDQLQRASAKATFFCVGQSMLAAPDLVRRILDEGHALGNHTFSHLSGWSSSVQGYLDDVRRCDQVVALHTSKPAKLFRPPYAQLGFIQGLRLLWQRPVVLWDVNAMDYLPGQTPSQVAQRVIESMRPGSIVLMHDSREASSRTLEALPEILTAIQGQGWSMKALGT